MDIMIRIFGSVEAVVIMRYLCLNQVTRPHKAETMAENTAKRKIGETMDDYNTSEDSVVPLKKAKRFRSAFTTEQIKYLDAEFKKYPYIGSARRKEVSGALNIPERAVKIWFQNRRMKDKKDVTSNNTECDEHKHSRKIDVANDQLNNECTVTSTNNRHYATLPLMSPKNETPKHIDVAIKKENETAINDNKQNQRGNTNHSSTQLSAELYEKYNIHFGNQEFSPRQQYFLDNEPASNPVALRSPKNEVTSTSPHEKLPQDLSRKRKPQFKPTRVPQNVPGGYFPLNLKKYYAEPSLPVGSNMLWKPVQILPMVPTGGSVAPAPASATKECHCECRCHPASPAPILLQQAAPNPLAQYVLTALPLPNPFYKY